MGQGSSVTQVLRIYPPSTLGSPSTEDDENYLSQSYANMDENNALRERHFITAGDRRALCKASAVFVQSTLPSANMFL